VLATPATSRRIATKASVKASAAKATKGDSKKKDPKLSVKKWLVAR
jgi:hypothetical protein